MTPARWLLFICEGESTVKKETNNSEYVKITKENFDYLVKRSWFVKQAGRGWRGQLGRL